jgi:methylphosphotriester-DNA--protein-cysteine methyltransferase
MVESKIMLLGASMPSRDEQYRGTFFVLVDRYKIYYKLSNDGKIAFVQTARHTRMQ